MKKTDFAMCRYLQAHMYASFCVLCEFKHYCSQNRVLKVKTNPVGGSSISKYFTTVTGSRRKCTIIAIFDTVLPARKYLLLRPKSRENTLSIFQAFPGPLIILHWSREGKNKLTPEVFEPGSKTYQKKNSQVYSYVRILWN